MKDESKPQSENGEPKQEEEGIDDKFNRIKSMI